MKRLFLFLFLWEGEWGREGERGANAEGERRRISCGMRESRVVREVRRVVKNCALGEKEEGGLKNSCAALR